MNEQIQKLAKEANCNIDGMGYGEGNLESFAELIVRECVGVIHTRIGPKSALDVLEHFGVV